MLILEPKPTKWIGTRSKLEIQNNSNYEIKYEASHYEEKQILRMEKEVNLNIPGVGGVGVVIRLTIQKLNSSRQIKILYLKTMPSR